MRSPTSASLSRFGASTRTREFGERQTLIGFLPEATHLRRPTRRFHLLSVGAHGPENLSVLADPAGLLHQRHVGKLREVTDENRPLRPERQVGSTYPPRPPPSLQAAVPELRVNFHHNDITRVGHDPPRGTTRTGQKINFDVKYLAEAPRKPIFGRRDSEDGPQTPAVTGPNRMQGGVLEIAIEDLDVDPRFVRIDERTSRRAATKAGASEHHAEHCRASGGESSPLDTHNYPVHLNLPPGPAVSRTCSKKDIEDPLIHQSP